MHEGRAQVQDVRLDPTVHYPGRHEGTSVDLVYLLSTPMTPNPATYVIHHVVPRRFLLLHQITYLRIHALVNIYN